MKIIYKKKECTGCGFCAASAPDFFEMGDDGLAILIKSKEKNEIHIKEITKEEFEEVKDIPDFCPMKVIKIEK